MYYMESILSTTIAEGFWAFGCKVMMFHSIVTMGYEEGSSNGLTWHALLMEEMHGARSSSLWKPPIVVSKFSLNEVFRGFWPKLLVHHAHLKARIFRLGAEFLYNTWSKVLYRQAEDKIPMWMVKGGAWKKFEYGLVRLSAQFIGNLHLFYVGFQLFTITEICPDQINAPPRAEFQGWMSRVRVTLVWWASKT